MLLAGFQRPRDKILASPSSSGRARATEHLIDFDGGDDLKQANPAGALWRLFGRSKLLRNCACAYALVALARNALDAQFVNYASIRFGWSQQQSGPVMVMVGLMLAIAPRILIPMLGLQTALLSGLLDAMLAEHRELLESVPERHPARTLRGHLETVLQSQEVDDDLSMAILATAASDPQLLDPLRGELSDDIGRILSDTQDPQGAMVVFWAIQGVRFQKLLKLPDGGADLRGRVIERLRTLIDELE